MKRIVLPAATALSVVVTLIALDGWNRSSEPRLQLTLTERELPRATNASMTTSGDNPGLQLRLNFTDRIEPLDARNWLTDERLASLGFGLDLPPTAPDAQRDVRRALPRIGWVAFEYNGETWRAIERSRELRVPAAPGQLPPGESDRPSRLVPVDASPDLDTLLRRYPTGHLIVRAVIHLGYLSPQARGGPLVYGYIRRVVPNTITVPRAVRDEIEHATSYQVDIALGRLGIPYVTGARRQSD